VQLHNIPKAPAAIGYAEATDAPALLAWLFKDAMIARLDAMIDAEADDKGALSHTERELRTAETMGDLLAVEREESFWVWQTQAQGLPVEHRSDINPLALLGVRLITPPGASNGHASSPEHAFGLVGR
jgi:hypothetical protein